MTGKNNVPQIRFKGFNNKWNEKPLEHFADVLDGDRGFNYPKQEDLQVNGHTLFLSAANVTLDGFKFTNNQYITEEKSSLMGNGKLIVNDIVLTSRGSLGNIAWYNENIQKRILFARINSGMLILRAKNCALPCAITHLLKSPLGQKKINLISFGSAQPQLTKGGVSSLSLILPQNKLEQAKIGGYFQSLDRLIEQKEKKYQKLQQFKKAMLGKMFPANDANAPSIRFNDFTENWHCLEFSKVFENISNNNLSRAMLNYDHGLAKNIHYGDVLIKFREVLNVEKEEIPFITNENIVSKFKSSKLLDGDVIISDAAEDSTVGKCTEIMNIGNEVVFSGLHTIAVRPVQYFASKYLGYYMNSSSYHNQLLPLLQGTKVLSISKSAIKNTRINYPESFLEQTKIGNYFQKLDQLIDLQQQELQKLKNLKKAFLAKMFV